MAGALAVPPLVARKGWWSEFRQSRKSSYSTLLQHLELHGLFNCILLTRIITGPAIFIANQPETFYQAVGWAQGRLNEDMPFAIGIAKDISEFYDHERVDQAWRWYRINHLIHTPFAIMPSWTQVVERIDEIRGGDLKVTLDYLGIREQHGIDKNAWSDVDHVCCFVLSLAYSRVIYEAEENAKAGRGFGIPYRPWSHIARWASLHALYSMLSQYQNEYAEDYLEKYPANYLHQYRSAESKGGVNPIVAAPYGLTPEAYMHQLNKHTTTFTGKLWSYFAAIA